ncbi:heparin lyase I family protein [Aliiroseovarius subalbicans]|uniref:heparin lyase I family protein n=1 Tax=Aliiroseovarius subalbicans TaxID=2925840 RepID=UPI001F5A8422|nr:heparin lyase I family protein [Aliiroseovarius subalbicans]MCI2398411.1 polysaccharide lyase [Aliiroseovarius subalbicans]
MRRLAFSITFALTALTADPSGFGLFTGAAFAAPDQGKSILRQTRIEKELRANTKYGYGLVRGNARAGRKSQRFELRHGDCGGNKYWDDCSNDRLRIERKEDPKNRIQRIGDQVWYGWSFFLDPSFRDIGPGNTLLGQMKMKGWRLPLWQFNMRDGKAHMWFGEDGGCTVGRVAAMRGTWQDVVIFADYGLKPTGPSFAMYINGKQVCSRRKPLITAHMVNTSDKELYLKYGVYSSYVSRWLERNKTRAVAARAFDDTYATTTGGRKTSASASSTPFAYDWGVELPTQIVFYDEMRYGPARELVDIRLLEVAGAKPLD